MAQIALTEKSFSSISIVFLVVFVTKVSVGTFETKIMLRIRIGQVAKDGVYHQKEDPRIIDNQSINSYCRTRNYHCSNRQSFENFMPLVLQEHQKPSIFCHSYSSSQGNSTSNL